MKLNARHLAIYRRQPSRFVTNGSQLRGRWADEDLPSRVTDAQCRPYLLSQSSELVDSNQSRTASYSRQYYLFASKPTFTHHVLLSVTLLVWARKSCDTQ